MEMIKIGVIVNTFGIRGEMKVKSFTDFVEERFGAGNTVYLQVDNEYIPMKVQQCKEHKGMVLLQFEGKDNINDIEKYKSCEIYIKKEELHQLDDGSYYFFELKDMKVIDQEDNEIGTVIQVEESLAHNLLRIKKLDGTTCLVPYVPAFIIRVDKLKKTIRIRTIEGLL